MNKQDLNSLLQLALISEKKEHANLFFEAMYYHFFGIIYSIVKNRFPNQVDDIIQDFYCKVILEIELKKYARIFPYLEPYLIRSLTNFCSDVFRQIDRELVLRESYLVKKNQEDTDKTYQPIDQMTDKLWLEFVLNQLNTRQKSALILRHYYGYPYKEIPEIMNENMTPAAAKQLVVRAKKRIHQLI